MFKSKDCFEVLVVLGPSAFIKEPVAPCVPAFKFLEALPAFTDLLNSFTKLKTLLPSFNSILPSSTDNENKPLTAEINLDILPSVSFTFLSSIASLNNVITSSLYSTELMPYFFSYCNLLLSNSKSDFNPKLS